MKKTPKQNKGFKLKLGSTIIPVYFVDHDVLQDIGKGLLTQSDESLYGMFRSSPLGIYINNDRGDGFETLFHELGEYVKCEYGLEISHEQLSVMTKVFADIFKSNAKPLKSMF